MMGVFILIAIEAAALISIIVDDSKDVMSWDD